ncbi:MAG: iron ABC transporter permease [Gammaproteobacteria bacterium]|nr:iron ABC transporter permease [Gammaproteobacteria bacterium]HJN94526.1 iron ABC transporter permease [Gammaproteobacteria bacterium]|tara:strand:- start:8059 stop:9099 length:1041 start_codon:yes stop_codon:yes gene_type:complete
MGRVGVRKVMTVLLVSVPAVILLYLALGPTVISPLLLFNSSATAADPMLARDALILSAIRLPRVLMAGLVGASLACCGAAMQGLFRNPLADPSLIGVSSGASAGASFSIVIGAGWIDSSAILGLSVVSLGAVVGAIIAVFLVYRLATNRYGTSVVTMLLSGVAIGAVASALNSLFSYFADSDMLRRISIWQMGNLDGATWERVFLIFVVALILCWRLPQHCRALNAFLLGESEARYLGIRVERVKKELVLITALAVGIGVVVCGNIAFVGLVVPHILRSLIGPDHRTLIPASALAGAILLIVADIVARTVIAPAELPAGILTSLVGAPVFFFLLVKSKVLNNPERL